MQQAAVDEGGERREHAGRGLLERRHVAPRVGAGGAARRRRHVERAARRVAPGSLAPLAQRRRPPGAQLEEQHAERVDVGRRRRGLAPPDLRRHVERRPGDEHRLGGLHGAVVQRARLLEVGIEERRGRRIRRRGHGARRGRRTGLARRRLGQELGEAEVEELHCALVGRDGVGRLDVAVEHAPPVRGREPAREAHPDLQRALPGDGLGQLRQALPAHVLGDEVRLPGHLADAVHGHHVGVEQPRDRARLDEEPRPRRLRRHRRRQQLDGDEPAEEPVLRQPHLAHRAAAEQPLQAELLDLLRRGGARGLGGAHSRASFAPERSMVQGPPPCEDAPCEPGDGWRRGRACWSRSRARLARRRARTARRQRRRRRIRPRPSSSGAEAQRLTDEGRFDGALPLYERVLSLRERALGKESAEVARTLAALADLHVERGELASAEPRYLRALAIATAIPALRGERADALSSLSDVYFREGDYGRAESHEERALEMREQMLGAGHPDVALSLSSLGRLYVFRGDYARAEPLLLRMLAIYEEAPGKDDLDVASGLSILGAFYARRGEHARAEPLLARALAIREKALPAWAPAHRHGAAQPGDVVPAARGLRARRAALRAEVRAIREQALGKDHPEPRHLPQQPGGASRLLTGDRRAARPLYERALAIRERALGKDHPEVAKALDGLASLHLAQGEIDPAVALELRAGEIVAHNLALMLATGSEAQKLAYDDQYAVHVDRVISMHARSAPAHPGARRLALTTVLRHKGLVLDAMIDGVAALRRHLTAADQALLDRLASVASRLGARINRGPGQALSRRAPGRPSSALEAERQKLEAELGARSAAFRAERRAVTLADVQAAIPADAALLELVRYTPYDAGAPTLRDRRSAPPRYAAYVLRRDGEPSFADLGGAAPIDEAARVLRAALAGDALASDPRPAARAAYARIVAPLRPLLGDTRRILISPDADLNLVPFAALIDDEGHYLLERYAFTYLLSGRELLRRGDRPPPREGPLVLAAPAYGASSAGPAVVDGKRGRRARDLHDHLPVAPLPGTLKEAQAIAGRLDHPRVLIGAEATEGAVKGAHAPVILHLATHGFFFEQPRGVENPLLRSGLLLAGANGLDGGGGDDGILTALEASQLDLSGTRLVVLSACETGLGKASAGEGVYGLRRALSIAGAETVAMSLWDADDDATRALMTGYYERLRKGAGRSEAMREAQLSLLSRPETAHPSLWAAFIVSGSGEPLDFDRVDVPRAPRRLPAAARARCRAPVTPPRSGERRARVPGGRPDGAHGAHRARAALGASGPGDGARRPLLVDARLVEEERLARARERIGLGRRSAHGEGELVHGHGAAGGLGCPPS